MQIVDNRYVNSLLFIIQAYVSSQGTTVLVSPHTKVATHAVVVLYANNKIVLEVLLN